MCYYQRKRQAALCYSSKIEMERPARKNLRFHTRSGLAQADLVEFLQKRSDLYLRMSCRAGDAQAGTTTRHSGITDGGDEQA
jgi:hypothetical protein